MLKVENTKMLKVKKVCKRDPKVDDVSCTVWTDNDVS